MHIREKRAALTSDLIIPMGKDNKQSARRPQAVLHTPVHIGPNPPPGGIICLGLLVSP